MYRMQFRLLLILGLVGASITARSQSATSANYNMVYSMAASGGVPSQSVNYKTTALVITSGPATKSATSTSYVYTPLVGTTASSASRVGDWQLY